MTANGEEQLVLGARKAGRLGLLLAPPLEAPQTRPKAQKPLILDV
jgi:hypothetical protein